MESKKISSSGHYVRPGKLKDSKWLIEKVNRENVPMELKIRIESDNRDVRNAISSIEDIIVLKNNILELEILNFNLELTCYKKL